MTIKILPSHIVDQIAAGEVVERPSAALKELIENSIDAGATKIDISISNGGKTFMSITDNGSGISKQDLPLALTRHATSKLNEADLFDLNFLGFRGEALPSIASVSRLKVTSKVSGEDAYEINVEGGIVGDIKPASINNGTRIEVRDLFFSVPARLKFLKADSTEATHITDIINRVSLCYPLVSFSLTVDNKSKLSYSSGSMEDRISQIMGRDFIENMRPIQWESNGLSLKGYISLPTFTKGTSAAQYLFVNGRAVKDKLLYGAIRAGYEGYVGRDIYPVVVVFLQLPQKEVDVNVHPAKTEIRFREASMVRGAIISAIKATLEQNAGAVATTVTKDAVSSFISSQQQRSFNYRAVGNLGGFSSSSSSSYSSVAGVGGNNSAIPRGNDYNTYSQSNFNQPDNYYNSSVIEDKEASFAIHTPLYQEGQEDYYPLGFAKAQLHNTYIVSQSSDGIVITDQHASHERLTYERLTENLSKQGVQTQLLLIPEVVDLEEKQYTAILSEIESLKKIGINIDKFAESSIIVRELPQLLGQVDVKQLVIEIADSLLELGTTVILTEKIKDICAIMSCHGSIRAGRKLSIEEMNALLRELEENPNTAQCIHGRPTYIKLDLKDIEKLFGRR